MNWKLYQANDTNRKIDWFTGFHNIFWIISFYQCTNGQIHANSWTAQLNNLYVSTCNSSPCLCMGVCEWKKVVLLWALQNDGWGEKKSLHLISLWYSERLLEWALTHSMELYHFIHKTNWIITITKEESDRTFSLAATRQQSMQMHVDLCTSLQHKSILFFSLAYK